MPNLDLESVKSVLRSRTGYVNRPFSGKNEAEIISTSTGMCIGYMSKADYCSLKSNLEFQEVPLPSEDGLVDWRGIVLRTSTRGLSRAEIKLLKQLKQQ